MPNSRVGLEQYGRLAAVVLNVQGCEELLESMMAEAGTRGRLQDHLHGPRRHLAHHLRRALPSPGRASLSEPAPGQSRDC
jgi:hypothetical protein